MDDIQTIINRYDKNFKTFFEKYIENNPNLLIKKQKGGKPEILVYTGINISKEVCYVLSNVYIPFIYNKYKIVLLGVKTLYEKRGYR